MGTRGIPRIFFRPEFSIPFFSYSAGGSEIQTGTPQGKLCSANS
jgi:hypothetical protein